MHKTERTIIIHCTSSSGATKTTKTFMVMVWLWHFGAVVSVPCCFGVHRFGAVTGWRLDYPAPDVTAPDITALDAATIHNIRAFIASVALCGSYACRPDLLTGSLCRPNVAPQIRRASLWHCALTYLLSYYRRRTQDFILTEVKTFPSLPSPFFAIHFLFSFLPSPFPSSPFPYSLLPFPSRRL